jgi:hypothetical protein
VRNKRVSLSLSLGDFNQDGTAIDTDGSSGEFAVIRKPPCRNSCTAADVEHKLNVLHAQLGEIVSSIFMKNGSSPRLSKRAAMAFTTGGSRSLVRLYGSNGIALISF